MKPDLTHRGRTRERSDYDTPTELLHPISNNSEAKRHLIEMSPDGFSSSAGEAKQEALNRDLEELSAKPTAAFSISVEKAEEDHEPALADVDKRRRPDAITSAHNSARLMRSYWPFDSAPQALRLRRGSTGALP